MEAIDRFLRYVSFDTQSDENSQTVPSTAKQKLLGEELARELRELGLCNAGMDENGYVYGFLPPSEGREEVLGLISHMDTAPGVSGANVRPRVELFTGEDLELGAGVVLSEKDFPFLSKYRGRELIVTDGTTLLGADDKAGVAEIVSAVAYFAEHPELPHKGVAVCFTPDEEIGSGADHFDFSRFPAKEAYTVDGGELGEIEYENFNAASVRVKVHGLNIHPGSAKNRMKNAALLLHEWISLFPPAETPAHTEGYEGFYHLSEMAGDESEAKASMIVRDHDRALFEARKNTVERITRYLNEKYGEGTFELEMRDSYYNMKEKILPHMELIDNARAAMEAVGVEPNVVPIRGGTDGARLSYEGLPCPNLCTGGMNFHGVHECIPVFALERMTHVLIELLK